MKFKKTNLALAVSIAIASSPAFAVERYQSYSGALYDSVSKKMKDNSINVESGIQQRKLELLGEAESNVEAKLNPVNRDSTFYGDRYSGVTTYNETQKAIEHANNSDNVLRNEVRSGQLSNAPVSAPPPPPAAPVKVEFVSGKTVAYSGTQKCTWSYNSGNRVASISAHSHGRTRTVSFAIPNDGVMSNRSVRYTRSYKHGGIEAVFAGGSLVCHRITREQVSDRRSSGVRL